jgi:cytochrome c oxidase cbb3-type subunit 3
MNLRARTCLCAVIVLMASPLHLRAQFPNPVVDAAAANRGAQLFETSCSSCHGTDARGTKKAPDLIRSKLVLRDRMQQLHGTDLEPALEKPPHDFTLSPEQLADISQFLTQEINRTLRTGYSDKPTHLLSGDPKAGKAYFYGAGGCSNCHSPTGDLAGIAKKFTPAALQQRWVFPNAVFFFRGFGARGAAGPQPPKTTVTVTLPSGAPVTGTLIRIDDFNVTLREASGKYRTFARTAGVKVVVTNPYAAHIALLSKYTDADIHNITAYLETLK